MPNLKKTFHKGIMDKDTDERMLSNGVYRHAENLHVKSSEGSDQGSAENILSNKRLTNIFLGSNIQEVGKFEDTTRLKLYWWVVSDSGCYIIEYDTQTSTYSFVLKDTRPVGERVLDLKRDNYITGISKIITEDINKDLLLFSDNNIEPCCINIERAKNYGENNFEQEDIYLIKKPPVNAPNVQLAYSANNSNNIEEKFFAFAYRYKYLDDEYSALSSYSHYSFAPKDFQIDYNTHENLAMVNRFNAARVTVNTGDHRVTEIQVIAKLSNSNNLYIVDTIKKGIDFEDIDDNETHTIMFTNDKLYEVLPEKELYRLFDNSPLKSKALTTIGSRVAFGNYVEGYDLLNNNLKGINIDFMLSLQEISLEDETDITFGNTNPDITGTNAMVVEYEPSLELLTGKSLNFVFYINYVDEENIGFSFGDNFQHILPNDYPSLKEVWEDPEFNINFTNAIHNIFVNSFELSNIDPNWEVSEFPEVTSYVDTDNQNVVIEFGPVTLIDTANNDAPHQVSFDLVIAESKLTLSDVSLSTSLHSNRHYEAALIYLDKWGRQTTALPSKNNSLYIPQSNSKDQNKLKVLINNPPPYWATHYKIAIKSQPLHYQTIVVRMFYNDVIYTWCKLEGDDKDKVKEGDYLILKSDQNGAVDFLTKTKVLEVKYHDEEQLIEGNVDESGNDLKELKGLYMKIKPTGFVMESETLEEFSNSDEHRQSSKHDHGHAFGRVFLDNDNQPINPEVPVGSEITVHFEVTDMDQSHSFFDKTFIAQRDYEDMYEWMDEILVNSYLPITSGTRELNFSEWLTPFKVSDYDTVRDNLLSGFISNPSVPNPYTQVDETIDYLNDLYDTNGTIGFILWSRWSTSDGNRSRAYYKFTLRTSSTNYIFETAPSKESELETFYQCPETFKIEKGNHLGNEQNQLVSAFRPAIVNIDFFNCYSFGNGVESYRIKDAFNSNFLNIDLKPTAVDIEGYKRHHRFSDITFSEPYVESTNLNGLNEFNASTGNWKELGKEHGAIQILHEREGDLLVIQRHKWGYVLFGKDAMYNTDGTTNVAKVPYVLGQWIPFAGMYGTSNPESFTKHFTRYYAVDKERGVPLRLSNNGLTPINYGMVDWFRDTFHKNPKAPVIGGIDPYNGLYQITIGDEPIRLLQLQCGNNITKYNQNETFTYQLTLNELSGDIVINYDVSEGQVDIQVTFNGNDYVESGVSGIGNITFERDSLTENTVTITITPISETASYEIGNMCPLGVNLTIISVIVNDEDDLGLSMTNRFRWSQSNFYAVNDLFNDTPVTRWTEEIGTEGQGKFPTQGSMVNMQAVKDFDSSGEFSIPDCNKLYYLITEDDYTEAQVQDLINNSNVLSVNQYGEENSLITQSAFAFNRANTNQKLYMIWDYRTLSPILNDDFVSGQKGQTLNVNVMANDEVEPGATVTVVEAPSNGTTMVLQDGTIDYTHDDSDNFEDSFVYEVNVGGCVSQATVYIAIGVNCSQGISAGGSSGIYEAVINVGTDEGLCGIRYNAQGVPDRFQIYWDGVLVADSLYVGDSLDPDHLFRTPTFLGQHDNLSEQEYDGSTFVETGTNGSVNVTQNDIADNINTPTDGNGTLLFNKNAQTPTTIRVVALGPVGGTAWTFSGVCPVSEEDLLPGGPILAYGFFDEAGKAGTTKSMGFWFDGNKFWVNRIGDEDFATFGRNTTLTFINDGVTWWEIDGSGNIISSGTI